MAGETKSLSHEFVKGFIAENPIIALMLGLCPTLAVTTSADNAVGMAGAATFVLLGSNLIVSLMRPFTPKKVRIPVFIVTIATFVTIVDLSMAAFFPPLHAALGIFIPLIVVNCIVLGRAEAFASKHGPADSLADGLGVGMGFTLSLAALGALREIGGAGTLTVLALGETRVAFGLLPAGWEPMAFLQQPPGAFVCLGLMLGAMNVIEKRRRAAAQGGS